MNCRPKPRAMVMRFGSKTSGCVRTRNGYDFAMILYSSEEFPVPGSLLAMNFLHSSFQLMSDISSEIEEGGIHSPSIPYSTLENSNF